MEDLTFGEQVKIILSRKGMTIKELAEEIEAQTGKAMSRQNLTQRLGRDNFQEQDMRMIAAILGCPFQLSIFPMEGASAAQGSEAMEDAVKNFMNRQAEKKNKKKQKEEAQEENYQQEELIFDEVQEEAPAAEETPELEVEDSEEWTDEQYAEASEEPTDERYAEASEEPAGTQYVEESEEPTDEQYAEASEEERDMTIGELYEIHEELTEIEENMQAGEPIEAVKEELEKPLIQKEEGKEEKSEKKDRFRTGGIFLRRKSNAASKQNEESDVKEVEKKPERKAITPDSKNFEPVLKHHDLEEDLTQGEVNPYTGREYQSNSVRMHPTRIGYVQVYDRTQHGWTDMTEWAFLGYQERKKALLGKDYEPPIYLD